MDRIGILGIGIMGGAYARNLLAAGFEVNGFDIDSGQRERFESWGGIAVSSAADLARNSDVVLCALPVTEALAQAVEGPDGIGSGASEGLVFVEMSTFPIEIKRRAKDYLEPLGVRMVDAPVSGTGLQADDATIVVYASGDEAGIEQLAPVFEAISAGSFALGEFGNGSKMKFVANLLVSVHNLATAEAFVLGMKGGLDPQVIQDVIGAGVGSSRIFEIRGPMIVADDYPAAARLKLFIKDISVISDFAQGIGVETPLLDASLPWYHEAIAEGHGDIDAAALARLLEAKAHFDRSA